MRILMAVALTAALAVPALATEFEQGKVTVQVADLDLATSAGQRALNKRLTLAIDRLCGTPVIFSRDEIAALQACEADALQMAAPQLAAARAQLAMTVAANR
jgi:UrcA family protein